MTTNKHTEKSRLYRKKHPEYDAKKKREAREKNPDRIIEVARLWWDNNPDKHAEYGRLWKKKNKEKAEAHRTLGHAVAAEKIIRPGVCESCGEPGFIEGHHYDYKKPLQVVWMCQKCHRALHRKYQ